MDIGIFAKIFARPTLEETLDAVRAHGIQHVQFNMACAGLPSLPERILPALYERIRTTMKTRGLTMTAVSGTFNLIHPDVGQRREGLRRLRVLAEACGAMGTAVITLCTGTRDAENMWRRHPDNDTSGAWADLLVSMREAIVIAEDYGVTLGVEPELSNVVDSAQKARRLLDELGSPRVKIVMDGSNLLHADQVAQMGDILDEAFDLLGRDIAIVHAKDLILEGAGGHGAAGTGVLDYDRYLARLRAIGFTGPLILHTLTEDQVDASVAFLRSKIGGPISAAMSTER
ncbi:MAG: sugar phosphate isomerase/epimerase [Chloroflexi bacterium]|nr:sugar phosphate isomerase/epimerase [Chloroflexota bacterium]